MVEKQYGPSQPFTSLDFLGIADGSCQLFPQRDNPWDKGLKTIFDVLDFLSVFVSGVGS